MLDHATCHNRYSVPLTPNVQSYTQHYVCTNVGAMYSGGCYVQWWVLCTAEGAMYSGGCYVQQWVLRMYSGGCYVCTVVGAMYSGGCYVCTAVGAMYSRGYYVQRWVLRTVVIATVVVVMQGRY